MGNTMQIAGISSRRSSVRFGLAVVACVAMLSGCNGGDNDQTISPALQETTGSAGNTPSSDIVASPSKPLEAPVIQVQESNDLGKPVIFSVLPSVNAPVNLRYLWDFGDGESSDQAAPQHTYRKAGSYPVTVAVIAPSGEQRVSPVANVTVDSCLGSNLGRGWCVQSGSVQNFDGSLLVAPSPVTTRNLNSVAALNADIAWIVGNNGTILRTKDGGASWVQQNAGTTADLLSISAINAEIAWVVGRNGTILKTVDGGQTWQSRLGGDELTLFSVFAADENSAWLLTSDRDVVVMRTIDGGDTWSKFLRYPNFGQEFRPPYPPVIPIYYSVHFMLGIDKQTALILATGNYEFGRRQYLERQFATNDGGNTWNAQVNPEPFALPERRPLSPADLISYYERSNGYYYFSAINQESAWRFARSVDSRGHEFETIDITVDAGKIWQSQTPGGLLINEMKAVNRQVAWAVGNNGLILKTASGGE